MPLPPRSGRSPFPRIALMKPEGSGRPVLGTAEPQADDRRARAAAQWGEGHAPPRRPPAPATIDQPLPPRLQTLLSYQIDPSLARQLTGGHGDLPASREANGKPKDVDVDKESAE